MKYQVQKNMRVKVTLAVSWPLGSRKDVRAEHVLKVQVSSKRDGYFHKGSH
jgi:hypothetical protein